MLIFFESSASFTVSSFLTVITIGLINCLSKHLSSLIICFCSNNLFNSASTLSCKCMGMRLPFCCIGSKSLLKMGFH